MSADIPLQPAAPSTAGAAFVAWLRKRGGVLVVFALLFLLWEYAVWIFGVKEYLLPPPSKVWTEFMKRSDIVDPARTRTG